MYVPKHFAVADLDRVASFVAEVGAADLVTFDGARPVASLIPVIWDRSAGQHGRLLGHVALANPQWSSAQPAASALAIVNGPQAYVSPSWYASKGEHGRVVPTWNYTTVHFTGPVTFHRDPAWLRDIVTRLTERHEGDRDPGWEIDDAPAQYVAGLLRAIVGVEMSIMTVEAKDKLSQNRSSTDHTAVVNGLRGEVAPGAAAVADLMEGHRTESGT